MAAIILDNHSCHLVYDLDLSLQSDDAAKNALAQLIVGHELDVIKEFIQVFSAHFELVFKRLPDLTGMHWETSCSDKKFSLHCHIITEAFINIEEYKHFIESFSTFIKDSYEQHGQQSLL